MSFVLFLILCEKTKRYLSIVRVAYCIIHGCDRFSLTNGLFMSYHDSNEYFNPGHALTYPTHF